MNQALPMKTINTTSGDPYVSLIDSGETFSIQYGRVVVTLEKRVIPEMIKYLTELNND